MSRIQDLKNNQIRKPSAGNPAGGESPGKINHIYKRNLTVMSAYSMISSGSGNRRKGKLNDNHTTFKIRKYKKSGSKNKKIDIMSMARERHQASSKRREASKMYQGRNVHKASSGKALADRFLLEKKRRFIRLSSLSSLRLSADGSQSSGSYKKLILERSAQRSGEGGRKGGAEAGSYEAKEAKTNITKTGRAIKALRWTDDYINGKTIQKIDYVKKGWYMDCSPWKMGYYRKPTVLVGYKQTGHFARVTKRWDTEKYKKMITPLANTKEKMQRAGKIILAESGKNAWKPVKSTITLSAKSLKEGIVNNYKSHLKEEGNLGGETAAQIMNTPRYAKATAETARLVEKTGQFALRTTCNTAKNTGIVVYNTANFAVRAGKAIYENRHNLPGYLKEKAARQKKKAAAKLKSLPAKIGRKIKAVVKKTIELLKVLVMKLLALLGGGLIIVLCILLPVIIILCIVIAMLPMLAPLQDNNSIRATNKYCNEMVVEWNEEIKLLKEKYEVLDNCPYGNNDKCEIHIKCEEEDAKVLPSTLELYAMAVIEFDYDIQNMGIPFGNKYEADSVSETDIKKFLNDCFYYLNPIKEEEMKIEQEILECYEEELNEEEEVEIHEHEYILTDIYIELKNIAELIAHLGWDNDKQDEYNDFLNELILESYYDAGGGEGEEWKSEIKAGSDYDYMPEDVFVEFWDKDVPVLNITRKEFTDMVARHCIPSGQIGYKFGAKDPSSGYLDCSGFTSWMFDLIGIDISEGTASQWSHSVGISAAEARPGDLVFKQSPNTNGINHTGIYLGEGYQGGKYAHCASKSGTIVNNYKGFIYFRRPLVKFKDDIQQKQ